jgi:hypothetical protein
MYAFNLLSMLIQCLIAQSYRWFWFPVPSIICPSPADQNKSGINSSQTSSHEKEKKPNIVPASQNKYSLGLNWQADTTFSHGTSGSPASRLFPPPKQKKVTSRYNAGAASVPKFISRWGHAAFIRITCPKNNKSRACDADASSVDSVLALHNGSPGPHSYNTENDNNDKENDYNSISNPRYIC